MPTILTRREPCIEGKDCSGKECLVLSTCLIIILCLQAQLASLPKLSLRRKLTADSEVAQLQKEVENVQKVGFTHFVMCRDAPFIMD